MAGQPPEIGQRKRKQHQHLDEETFERRRLRNLPEIAIGRETAREVERYPGELTQIEGEDRDAEGGEHDREDLRTRETLAQKGDAEQHTHQWVHVVAEARLHDAGFVDRIDEDEPVGPDQEPRADERQQRAAVAEHGHQGGAAAEREDEEQRQDDTPDGAMRQHLEGRHIHQLLVEDDGKAPEEIAGSRRSGAERGLARRC